MLDNPVMDISAFDAGWRCELGFKFQGEVCVETDLPENAHLDLNENAWSCDREVRKPESCAHMADDARTADVVRI